jgi:hypothetical protein
VIRGERGEGYSNILVTLDKAEAVKVFEKGRAEVDGHIDYVHLQTWENGKLVFVRRN